MVGYFFRSVKLRKPAWCDRVLWRESPTADQCVKLDSYVSCESYVNSDHKPIRADFSIRLKVIASLLTKISYIFSFAISFNVRIIKFILGFIQYYFVLLRV